MIVFILEKKDGVLDRDEYPATRSIPAVAPSGDLYFFQEPKIKIKERYAGGLFSHEIDGEAVYTVYKVTRRW